MILTCVEQSCFSHLITILVPCEPLPPLDDGTLQYSDDSLEHGTTVQYTCRRGLELRGPAQRRCQRDGNWSAVQPVCCKLIYTILPQQNNAFAWSYSSVHDIKHNVCAY